MIYLDLRDELERAHEPLSLYLVGEVLPWTLEQLERSELPALERGALVTLVCALGEQSKLGAYFLASDGFAATSLEGGVLALRRAHERHFALGGVQPSPELERRLLNHPRVRQFRISEGVLEVWGTVSEEEWRALLER